MNGIVGSGVSFRFLQQIYANTKQCEIDRCTIIETNATTPYCANARVEFLV